MDEITVFQVRLHESINSPIGTLDLKASEQGLISVSFSSEPEELDVWSRIHPYLQQASRQLLEYFSGNRIAFSLKLDLKGTPWQQDVWEALLSIPYGQTCSYKEIAEACQNPKGARAVGLACNRNPLPVILPCHRVVASDDRLTGYAGGIERKARLLQLEQTALSRNRLENELRN